MAGETALSKKNGSVESFRIIKEIDSLRKFIEEYIEPLKDNKEIDYPLFKNGILTSYNIGKLGIENTVDIDHPLSAYAQSKPRNDFINYYKEATKHFFINYPESYKLIGVSLTKLRSLEVAQFEEFEDFMDEYYKIRRKNPDVLESFYLEFRQFARLSLGVTENDQSSRRKSTNSEFTDQHGS